MASSGGAGVQLADAQDGGEAVAVGGGGLQPDDGVVLAEDPAAFGVADLGVAAAEFGHGFAADLTGERAFVFPEDVLGARGCPGGAEDAGRLGKHREGGQDEQLDVAVLDGRVRERRWRRRRGSSRA